MPFEILRNWGLELTRKESAIELIDQIISDRANMDIPTVELLYRCQDIGGLLDLSSDDVLWIELELSGYPNQNPLVKDPPGYNVPLYRRVQLPAKVEDPRLDRFVTNDIVIESMTPFSVIYSCGQLESANEPLPLGYSHIVNVPEVGVMGTIGQKEEISFTFKTLLPTQLMKGIIQSVRGRINKFASSHQITLRFEEPLDSIFNSSRGVMADRLSRLHTPLLALIEETVTKQERSTDPVEWQDVLENTRNIIRNITEQILHDTMVPDGEERPNINETNKKTELILQWIRENVDESVGTQSEYVIKMLESISLSQTALIDLVNKLGHPPASQNVVKRDVDRLVLNTMLWIFDVIALLDKAGFSWDNQ